MNYPAAHKAQQLVDQLAEHLRIVDGQAMIEGDDAQFILADALQEAYRQGVIDGKLESRDPNTR